MKWAPATTEDEALWHVKLDDGDSEDLDENEAMQVVEAGKK